MVRILLVTPSFVVVVVSAREIVVAELRYDPHGEPTRTWRAAVADPDGCGPKEMTTQFSAISHLVLCGDSLDGNGQGHLRIAVAHSSKTIDLYCFTPAAGLVHERRLRAEKRITHVAFCARRSTLVVSDKSGDVGHARLGGSPEEQAAGLVPLLGHVSIVPLALVSPCADFVLSLDREAKIRVSRYPDAYAIEHFLLAHESFVCAAAFCSSSSSGDGADAASDDAQFLVSGGGDDFLVLWNWRDGTPEQVLHVLDVRSALAGMSGVPALPEPSRWAVRQILAARERVYFTIDGVPVVVEAHVTDSRQLSIVKVHPVDLQGVPRTIAFAPWSSESIVVTTKNGNVSVISSGGEEDDHTRLLLDVLVVDAVGPLPGPQDNDAEDDEDEEDAAEDDFADLRKLDTTATEDGGEDSRDAEYPAAAGWKAAKRKQQPENALSRAVAKAQRRKATKHV